MEKIIIPEDKKGKDYCGSKRIHLGAELSVKDAKFIESECPEFGVRVISPAQPKPKKRKSKD